MAPANDPRPPTNKYMQTWNTASCWEFVPQAFQQIYPRDCGKGMNKRCLFTSKELVVF